MKIRLPKLLLTAAACAYVLGGTIPAGAQTHLKCYKVRDPQARARYTANLSGLTQENGCQIRVPARMVCVPSNKTNVSPVPPGGGATGTPNKFACYKVRCPRAVLPNVAIHDQFGNRSITPKRSQLLCAPASPSGAFLDDSSMF